MPISATGWFKSRHFWLHSTEYLDPLNIRSFDMDTLLYNENDLPEKMNCVTPRRPFTGNRPSKSL
jgi:hypothetical protein